MVGAAAAEEEVAEVPARQLEPAGVCSMLGCRYTDWQKDACFGGSSNHHLAEHTDTGTA